MDGIFAVTSGLEPFQRWVLVIAAVLTIVYAVMRPMRKKKDPLAVNKKQPMSLAGQRQIETQMTDLIVELEKMARQMTSQLETRAARLEVLIRDADERIETLRSMMAKGVVGVGMGSLPGQGALVGSHGEDMPDPRHAEVYDLAQSGHSAHQIAQRLGRPYGEVELILALRGHERAERQFAVS